MKLGPIKDIEKSSKVIDFQKISKSKMNDSYVLTRMSFFSKRASLPTTCISIGTKKL